MVTPVIWQAWRSAQHLLHKPHKAIIHTQVLRQVCVVRVRPLIDQPSTVETIGYLRDSFVECIIEIPHDI